MIGPKEKKERALGEHLNLKGERCLSPKCAMVRKPYRPGMHGQKRSRRNVSEFGLQIREKQKFKYTYGIDERNLRKIFEDANRQTGSVGARLVELLERRLDNVVFRLGFTRARGPARQLITHGHITVNKRKVRSPGYRLENGDVVGFRKESIEHKTFANLKEYLEKYEVPSWLVLDKGVLEGSIISSPSEITMPFEINLLVESFSK